MTKEIYGMLSTMTVELPYETEEEKKRAGELNAQLKGLGVRTFRGATDWCFRKYESTTTYIKNNNPLQKHIPREKPERFQSGDLVKIFKTVADGDICWQGTLEYDYEDYHHGLQKGLSANEWARMFYDQLPARLETKDGKVIYGALEPFCETGTEGTIWSLHEYGKAGYDGLHCLEEGDKLTVYSYVRDGDVEWQGRLDFGPEQVKKIGWTEIMRETNHMDTQKWLQMSWENRPAVIIKGP